MLDIVIEARNAAISESMKVKRILPFRFRRMVGPFIFMDHAGPIADLPSNPSSLDVLPHPHIGLSTVSYLFGGQVTHRDSLGVEQIIRPGEVNWMTAGKGIAHSERFEDPAALKGGNLEMIQTWVALPEKDEELIPTLNNYTPDLLPIFTDKGVWMRLIAEMLMVSGMKLKQIHHYFICMYCWSRVQRSVFLKNIQNVAFILLKGAWKCQEIFITQDKCLCSTKALIQLSWQKKIRLSCFWR